MAGSKGDDFGDRQAMADLHQAVSEAAAALHNVQGSKLTLRRDPNTGAISVEIGYTLYPSCGCACPCDALPVAGTGGSGILAAPAANDVEPTPAPAPYSEKVGRSGQRLRSIAGGVH